MNRDKVIKFIKNVLAVVVVLCLLVIIFYQNRDRDIFKFGKTESSQIVTADPQNDTSHSFAKSDAQMLGDDVALLSPSNFSVLDKQAEGENVPVAFVNPVLYTEDDYAVIYDEGTKNIAVYKNSRLSYSIVAENDVICAKVNGNGYLFIATKKEGYNCECLVYNKNGEAIFKWDVSKSEFIDGAVNYSNSKIVLSLASAEGNVLRGEIVIIDITNAKIVKKHLYDANIFYEIRTYKNDTCAAFSNNILVYFNTDGEEKWKYDYSGRSLVKADISVPDTMILAFLPEGTVVSGSTTDIEVINRIGVVSAKETFEGSIDDISLNQYAFAFAFGKKIVITNEKLKEKKVLENDSGISKIALFSDNKHVLVIGSSEVKILE